MVVFTEKELKRFFSKVDQSGGPDECHEWQGRIQGSTETGHGYGSFSFRSRAKQSHRIAYMIANPGENIVGRVIGHECNNVKCCNPRHLISTTHAENMAAAGRDGLLRKADRVSKEESLAMANYKRENPDATVKATALVFKRDRDTVSHHWDKHGVRVRPVIANVEERAS